ncbi:MAG: HAMP domain-containing histidine kinase [Lentisphaerae bacterium]|nr:HAMP domain-containing histidine kinase [Lentisphaerota bacterium]
MESTGKRRRSFAWMAAASVALMALLAGGGLFGLRRWHSQAAHQAAAQAVAERGQWLAMSLALRAAAAAGKESGDQAGAWQDFSGLLRSLREVEADLEFVAVRRNGVTLFQEHADSAALPGNDSGYRFEGPVSIGRQRLSDGAGQIPVVTFSVGVANSKTAPIDLELGLRRRAVEREEWAATSAIESMYRLSLVTMAACFGVCLALVVIVVRREERRESARRREEHLAFSGMLANGIVHDFRNPMSSLRLDAQMLAKEAARGAEARTERMAELAGRMRHTFDRMEKVFQEFLLLARPGEAAAVTMDLAVCARECLEMLAPRFEAAGITPELRASEGSVRIRAVEASVKRAMLNVLLNASQHAGTNGRVAVEVARAGTRARLDVCDSGPGIPRADRERVFEVFYTTRPQGTGLGLFLARTAIENHGGTLAVADPEGVGARLRMEFPLAGKEDA